MDIEVFRRKKRQFTIFALVMVGITLLSSKMTDFDFIHSLLSIPEAFKWMASNLFITSESLEKMPSIMDKLFETIFLSIAATTTASVFSLLLALLGSQTTKVNNIFSTLSRLIASVFRNIPIVAWALILLLSFGQNALTGYFALFLATLGFLTRAFTETIDETGKASVEALQATGANYFQVVAKAVIPECSPQIISWILFMIETNIRSSTLIGILTGTGIGFAFDLYYKSMNYNVLSLITISIVAVVIAIELVSNYVRRVIL
ncbi:MAG TPA: phosphate/phosphonate ABC transporter permease [Bacillus bacterium]|uniref:Phosphonate ABC transporter, permease protein PhnE n=1 Tax=Siminovitchia fordii TaxID=254759 RepID=A0ABQ4KA11_9BACI|nr:phosphate/phosphonate ABC transporter permease [Siminovitchia fordii]GIN21905.1 phosphonate ABC transporter, permease protein PhnE [Siminovitchia fordii]HBZ11787.1 phosphate/phosphonate ABC transporter permease [Bacillus sp. (in: firmicutes)]